MSILKLIQAGKNIPIDQSLNPAISISHSPSKSVNLKQNNIIYWTAALILTSVLSGCGNDKQYSENITPIAPVNAMSSSVGENGYRWANVSIGGGSFVTGIYIHPRQKDIVYLRTDIGGFYRWNASNKSWIPLTDSFTQAQQTYYGGEALAFDPNNPNIVYIAAGKYSAWKPKGSIFKSSDRGQTWQKLNLDLGMDSNDKQRWAGMRLAVNPHNSNIIFFGSRHDGLWKSQDAGKTWTKVTSLSAKLTPKVGVLGILFDKQKPGLIYANVFGDGIYKSTDTGITWSKIVGSPNQPQRMAINQNGILYVTALSGVSKYANEVWTNITPPGKETFFNALAINPKNSNEIIIASGQSVKTKIYQSSDAGKTWTEKTASLQHTVPWWNERAHPMFSIWTSAIEFDPHIPGKVWLTDGFGIWQTNNINTNPVVWTNYQQGHEEVVSFALAAPAKGPVLLSALADVVGFNHDKGLKTYPSHRFHGTPEWRDTLNLDYSQNNPQRVVRVGGARWNSTYTGATSTDGGSTWQKFPSFPAKTMPLRVAVSATNPDLFVIVTSKAQPLRTTDNGTSWKTVSGLPDGPGGPWFWNHPLAADKVEGNTFYYHREGKTYRSVDGGSSFTLVNSSLPYGQWDSYAIKTVPGFKNEVWISLDKNGLYRSTDGGTTFTKLPSVEKASLFAFGKPPQNSNIPALYLYGKVKGIGDGIFRSLDRGQTWVSIGSRENPIGNEPNTMEGSWQQFGLVFIGTNGRGIFYGTPDNSKALANNLPLDSTP
ncbi:WD40/YVTN/BNR-like repeat-containing protein [[Phormidium ambiguum] IAM M-71]|uniref:WD40/YVTN/BNR-like repeat-containing protein n=1 Tax=[Phormidium ambiguum] IAM M-71 TaxID=454136 RepID=UPI001160FB9C|nr:hypothetical protein [Phormidium ambiguum]